MVDDEPQPKSRARMMEIEVCTRDKYSELTNSKRSLANWQKRIAKAKIENHDIQRTSSFKFSKPSTPKRKQNL